MPPKKSVEESVDKPVRSKRVVSDKPVAKEASEPVEKPVRKKRVLSEEQKVVLRDRLVKAREARTLKKKLN